MPINDHKISDVRFCPIADLSVMSAFPLKADISLLLNILIGYSGNMKNRLIYVEQKSGGDDCGVAWIGIAGASKTGATIYSNGKAFKSLKGSGIGANYFEIESGAEYWVSGIKKNNQDRHWAGGGDILIDKSVIKTYL